MPGPNPNPGDPFWWIDRPPRRRRKWLRPTTARRIALVAGTSALLWAASATRAVLEQAEQVRAGYGEQVRVPVAGSRLELGAVVTEAEVEWQERPRAVVPEGAAHDPVGRTVTAPVVAGEVIVEERLAGVGEGGVVAQLEAHERALGVARALAGVELEAGDRVVAVVATPWQLVDPTLGGDVGEATARTVPARVVAVGDDTVVLAVAEADLAAVALGAMEDRLSLALAPS